ncbi:MAG: hypothetical protein LBK47_06650 [Prevotellaceae bacterium]|jgi:hypothetical protein|nr:hypothetical protein [Prevotellaceae bacterium]
MKIYEKAGDFLLNVAQLVIGGVILAGIMSENVSKYVLYVGGITFTVGLIVAAFIFYKIQNKNKE